MTHTLRKAIISLTAAAAFAAITPLYAQSQKEFSTVYNPDVPKTVKFAGKTVDLDRVDMYERLDRELTSMAYTHGNTLLTIKRANRYFPVIAPILKEEGIPEDFLYLACIESTLNPRAYSSAKAAGIWQFIASAAKEHGLEVNDEVDERYNLEKATRAAARYLKRAYNKYGNWESAAASYNGGQARITRELQNQDVDTAYDLYLTDETSRYMFRLLAMKLIMENPKAYGFNIAPSQLYQPMEGRKVKVTGPVKDWVAWAKQQGITYAQLREANPWIRAKTLTNKTGKTYEVLIPDKSSLYRSKQNKSIVYNPKWTK